MILLVEDDDDVRDMVALGLGLEGYPVVCAKDGAEALATLATLTPPPCLMILDLRMPVMSGLQVLAQMAARGITGVPVCVISAQTDVPPPEAVATLHKPFASDQLFALAARYCTHAVKPGSS